MILSYSDVHLNEDKSIPMINIRVKEARRSGIRSTPKNMNNLRFIASAALLTFFCLLTIEAASNQAKNPTTRNVNTTNLQDKTVSQPTNVKTNETYSTNTVNQRQSSANKTSKNFTSHFGNEASSSILRPLILRGLLGNVLPPMVPQASAASPVEEEEEVTQTIMMPMKDQQGDDDTPATKESVAADEADTESSKIEEAKRLTDGLDIDEGPTIIQAKSAEVKPESSVSKSGPKLTKDSSLIQPKAEASLQLTSTEMSNLLHDREGPDYYRERELHGEGVLLREEQPVRIPAASSLSHYGEGHSSGYVAPGYGGAGFGRHESELHSSNRLLHAATEAGFGPSSFSHRFGHSGYHSGGLMQSPSGDFNSDFHQPSAEHYSGYGGHHGFSSHSGEGQLLRAGSGDYIGSELGHHHHSAAAGHHFDSSGYATEGSGYLGSPRLESHSSELYGPGFGGGHGLHHGSYGGHHTEHLGSEIHGSHPMYGHSNARLMTEGSHHHHHQGLPYGASSGSVGDEYSNRYGHSPGVNFDHRGFATQNRIMHRGHSMQTDSIHDDPPASAAPEPGEPTMGSGSLMPLTPVVPVAEEVASATEDIEKESMAMRSQTINKRVRDSMDSAADSEANQPNGDDMGDDNSVAIQSRQSNNDRQQEVQFDNAAANEFHAGDKMSSVQARNAANSMMDKSVEDHNLILNVPPPTTEAAPYRSQAQVEFTRIGSAGYLGPNKLIPSASRSSSSTSATGGQQSSEIDESGRLTGASRSIKEGDSSRSNYDPADNPAHENKYIID